MQKQKLIDLFTSEEDAEFNGFIKNENANKYDSYSKLRGLLADEDIKDYALSELYPQDIAELHISGFFHIHDLADAIVPYCKGHDTKIILVRGLKTKTIVAGRPHHLGTFLNQIMNYLATSQQEWAGAQAIPDLNTLASPFIRKMREWFAQYIPNKEHLNIVIYKLLKQEIQRHIFDFNFPSRAGNQTPFINVTLNLKCPDHLKDETVYNYGCEGTYGEYEEEARLFLMAYNDILYRGDEENHPFTFPLTTISLLPDTDFSDPVWIDMMRTQVKYGSYSFFNYIGSGISPNSVWSMCCHLVVDLSQLPATGGRWAYEGGTGSIGVVTFNMARLGYLAQNKQDLYSKLDELLDGARRALIIKGMYIEKNKHRLMPLSMEYGFDHKRFFRTIGIVGLHEMCVNFHDKKLSEDVEFVKEVLEYIRTWTVNTQIETGVLWNLEMTPAESTVSRFAKIDKKRYGSSIFAQGVEGAYYYTSMVTPPNQEMILNQRIAVEQEILPLFTGGTVFRIYIGESSPSPEGIAKLVERIAKYSRVPYFDIAPSYSICKECNLYMRGAVSECRDCGSEVLTYDRIVGYYRPRLQANDGKIQEIKERRNYLN